MLLEKSVRSACEGAYAAAQVPAGYTLSWSKGLSGPELRKLAARRGIVLPADFRIAGFEPDGGLFCLQKDGGVPEPFLVAEAKFQDEGGNAIERWHKNYNTARFLARDIMMLTFITGPGAALGKVMERTLNVALLEHAYASNRSTVREWNTLYHSGPSMFAAPQGFDPHYVRRVLDQALSWGMDAVLRR